jgi:hypothetical protein
VTETGDTSEMDLTLKLLESGLAKLKVGPDGLELKVTPALPTAMVGEVVRSRMNARMASYGFGPKGPRPDPYEALGVRYHPRPGRRVISSLPEPLESPVMLEEEAHRVAECPECVQGKHGNCDGSAWCRAHDALELCPCAQNDHQ